MGHLGPKRGQNEVLGPYLAQNALVFGHFAYRRMSTASVKSVKSVNVSEMSERGKMSVKCQGKQLFLGHVSKLSVNSIIASLGRRLSVASLGGRLSSLASHVVSLASRAPTNALLRSVERTVCQ